MCTDEFPLFLLVLFRAGGKTPDPKMQVRSYVDVMLEQNLSKEEVTSLLMFIYFFDLLQICPVLWRSSAVSLILTLVPFYKQREIRLQMAEKAKSGDLKVVNGSAAAQAAVKRKRRWDQTADQTPSNTTPKKMSSWDQADTGAEVNHLI